jgi:hypothetical protein
MEKLNNLNGGWYLPHVQRQYVWGARYQSEEYVCLLLDSIVKRYPIGGLVLWETTERVPHREFLGDYEPGKFARLVEEGRQGVHKFLVYDGQQRLQTFRSVLYYTFNKRALHFDLLFDPEKANPDETGFLFRDLNTPSLPRYLKLTELVSLPREAGQKIKLEYRLLHAIRQVEEIYLSSEILVRTNISALWDVFVDTNVKSIAYFSVKANKETMVNEVFRRLNTGGVALTQVELVLSKIKEIDPTYEEKLWVISERIRNESYIEFTSAEILQFFYLILKGTTRIDAYRVSSDDDARRFLPLLDYQDALVELFPGYLLGIFKINHSSIVPRWLAALPLAAYLTELKQAGREWRIRVLSAVQIDAMNTYFLFSQFCDWNTQTMVNAFTKLCAEAGAAGSPLPVTEIRAVAVQKNRTGGISEQQFLALPWFAAKILMPRRQFVFHENKPQLDHIFPLGLSGADDQYREAINVLWNLQPVPDVINNYKRARHPGEFFHSTDGSKYWDEYDFVPDQHSSIWDYPFEFIEYRKKAMRDTLLNRYGVQLETVS